MLRRVLFQACDVSKLLELSLDGLRPPRCSSSVVIALDHALMTTVPIQVGHAIRCSEIDVLLMMTEGYTASYLADCFLLDSSCCRRAA